MAKRPKRDVHVQPRTGGRWAVQEEGSKRASKVFDQKAAAERHGLDLAKKQGGNLVVHSSSGRVERRWIKCRICDTYYHPDDGHTCP